MTGLPSGSVMPASVGPPGTSKGSATMVAPSDTDRVEGGPQVGHLDVEGHAGPLAGPDVAAGAGLGPADAGRDLHDEAVADLPVEEVRVEGALPLGVDGLNLPMHHRPCPVLRHATSLVAAHSTQPDRGPPGVEADAARVGVRTRRATGASGTAHVRRRQARVPDGRSARAKRVPDVSRKDRRGVPFRRSSGLWHARRRICCRTWRHGRRSGGGTHAVTHWTHVLSNVSLVEFVLLAALTTLQWVRHRIRGAGWVALSFAILGGLSLALKIDPGLVTNQNVAKALIALLLVMPYCLFRFAATFRTPSRPRPRRWPSSLTVGIVLFTFTLQYLPAPGLPAPPHFLAYRISFLVAFGFLCGYVVVSLFLAGRGEPPIAASRMHLLAARRGRAGDSGGGGRARAAGPHRRPAHAGADGGDGRPVPGGAGAPLLRARLPEPQGGRRLPAGGRRARVRR